MLDDVVKINTVDLSDHLATTHALGKERKENVFLVQSRQRHKSARPSYALLQKERLI